MIARMSTSNLDRMLADGKSVAKCAEATGVSAQTIYRLIKSRGLQLPRKKAYQHLPHGRDLAREVKAGATIKQLAEKYEVVELTIRNRIKRAGYAFAKSRVKPKLVRRDDLNFHDFARLSVRRTYRSRGETADVRSRD
ncbi:hypothetical protein GO014_07620 [Devosia sp. L53-10-65]|uniref:Resolvase HTH domain-containing protein n=2 Tax=Devosia marina TaxID=2683198 RepID=A0A7X3K338_9HYPH|nr:hypothetical protein [Devosia marina]